MLAWKSMSSTYPMRKSVERSPELDCPVDADVSDEAADAAFAPTNPAITASTIAAITRGRTRLPVPKTAS